MILLCARPILWKITENSFFTTFLKHINYGKRGGTFFNEVNFDRFSNTLKTIIFWEACFFLKGRKITLFVQISLWISDEKLSELQVCNP